MYVCASEENTSLHEEDTPLHFFEDENGTNCPAALKEGFALCGLFNLPELLNAKLQEFDEIQKLKSVEHSDQDKDDNELNACMLMMDKMNYAIAAAENLIVDRFKNDHLCQTIFAQKLTQVIDKNLDIDLESLNSSSWLSSNSDHETNHLFVYCLNADLMQPTTRDYVTNYFSQKSDETKRIIKNNKISVFNLLMKYEVDLKSTDYNFYNFYECAVKYQSWNIVPILVANKIPGSVDALCDAAASHQNDAVRQLIKCGVDVNGKKSATFKKGKDYTVLDYAHWNDNKDIMPFLHAAQQEALLITDEERYVMHDDEFDMTSYDSNTPLHLAVLDRDHDKVSSLVADGADLHAKNSSGKIPWDLAASAGMRSLLKPPTKPTENTPLLKAAKIKNFDKDSCSIS